jgi:PBP1b-binding outer membrane lipoprotein LpoB
MTKKIKNIVSVFMIALLFNSCGNSSECVNWEEYHEDIDFDDREHSW